MSINNSQIQAAALAVRSLSMDAIQAANSGHPGLPLGLAELGAFLYGEAMQLHPEDPMWPNRDRLVLSAGHGSMLLYSLLHLAGFDLPLDELKRFRQIGSKTPGHPEWGHTVGVETTTGPLGQGIANAVGMAIAETMMAARFNSPDFQMVDHYTYCIAGDGCMMEGISSEAASLAGHLKLGKLIVFYDDNKITIDGGTDISFSEDVQARFSAYGWHVQQGDAYDIDELRNMLLKAKEDKRPSLISLKSIIGKGSPGKQGTSKAHGAALGAEEVQATKRALGLPENEFFTVPDEAYAFFAQRRKEWQQAHGAWVRKFAQWSESNQGLREEWDAWQTGMPIAPLQMPAYGAGEMVATRVANQRAMEAIAKVYPSFVGGSADLAESNKTKFAGHQDYSSDNRAGKSINYGVREHAMAAASNGIALYGGFKSFCATFLVFADYLRPSIRLAALMNLPSIFVFTHDSIFVGEDGPTHEPIEHFASLRIIPNLYFYRPADAEESNLVWQMSMERRDGPSAMAFSRQNLPVLEKSDANWQQNIRRGAYVVSECEGQPEIVIVATGSEVSMALEALQINKAQGKDMKVRVVSMPCRELFLQQDAEFRQSIIPGATIVVAAEAGVSQGWEVLTGGRSDLVFSIDRFGMSGPGEQVAEALGYTAVSLARLLAQI